jgi:3-hydroxyisobutyrate dehydrogenase-like beta-hydroxyacid dehydrogenase
MIQAVHALAEALAIADASGVDGATLFDVFSKGSADSQVLRYQGIKFMLPRNFPRAAFPTSYAKKDMGLAIELAAEYGIDTRLAQHTFDFLDHAIDAGHSLDYYPVILTLFKPRGPVA